MSGHMWPIFHGPVMWFCLISWRLFDVWTSYFGILSQFDTAFDLKINVEHYDLYLMVQWFCLMSRRLFDVWTSYFRIMSQYVTTFDLKINVGHCDLYFMVQWCDFALYLEDYLMFEHHTLGLWAGIWPKNKHRSLWPIFDGSVVLPYILATIWYMNTILRDYESVWPDVWPKINVCHCDLYFMVQWFCFISWRLFDVWTSYFGIMSQYDPTSDLKIFVGHCVLYFMVHWICLISWRPFDVWTSYFGIMSR